MFETLNIGHEITALAFDAENIVSSTVSDGELHVILLTNKKFYDRRTFQQWQHTAHLEPVRALSLNKKQLVTGGSDNIVKVWKLK